jgi:ornithine cyclodeaminase/alanine dehydrogenase-like protein (mu-crystallin family)
VGYDEILVLGRSAIMRCLADIDVIDVITSTLRSHAAGYTTLPAEGYLPWRNSSGHYARSVAMLGAVAVPGEAPNYGVKIINAAVDNPARGIDRAGGVVMLFDAETARPAFLGDAAVLSAVRTAGYTMASIRFLGPTDPTSVAIIGCGALARAHLELLAQCYPSVERAFVYDLSTERMRAFADWATSAGLSIDVKPTVSAADCIGSSNLLITVTVSDKPYIEPEWFTAPTFVAHVSLDDITPQVFSEAAAIYVDDIGLVVDNPRRILGRLIADGQIAATPDDEARPHVRGTLAAAISGDIPAERPSHRNVISNPFGMAVLDVAMTAAVRHVAQNLHLGHNIDLTR